MPDFCYFKKKCQKILKYSWKNVKNTIKTIEKMSNLCYTYKKGVEYVTEKNRKTNFELVGER